MATTEAAVSLGQHKNSQEAGHKKVKQSGSDRVNTIILYIVCAIIIVIMLYPMYFIVIASISNPNDVALGNVVLWPVNITLRGYEELLKYPQIWSGYRNTIIYTVLGTLVSIAVNVPAGYVLANRQLVGRKVLTVYYLIPMFFTGGLIPTYMTIRSMGMLDTLWVMIIPFAVSTYYIIVSRTFFDNSIPRELWEAAQLDGCSSIQYFFRIALPLSKAVVAVVGLWTAVGLWNGYFNALIYLRSPEKQPLQIILRNILISNQTIASTVEGSMATEAKQMADLIKYASIVVSSLPIMCLYPFVQKYFNQGVMLGSVKD